MNGVLVVNKPKGFTSRDVVNKVSRIIKVKKVGHTGTLDPDVTGVLVLCVGRATKLVPFLTADSKEYIAEVSLGVSTTTEDASGDVINRVEVNNIHKDDILNALTKLTGEITQTPPMYSAVKVNGKRLYEYARSGIEVERPSRKVKIHKLDLISDITCINGECKFMIFTHVSKGTYIRTLSTQIGDVLNLPAHMSNLKRVKQGEFSLTDAYTIEDIEAGNYKLLSISEALKGKTRVDIDENLLKQVKNGAVIDIINGVSGETVLYYNNEALAIYDLHPTKEGKIKPVRVL